MAARKVAKKKPRTRKAAPERKIARVNPDTGRTVRVGVYSQEALDWPTVAEYRAEQKKVKRVVDPIGKAASAAIAGAIDTEAARNAFDRGSARVVGAVGRTVAAGRRAVLLGRGTAAAGVASLGVAGTAAAVAAAFGVGYAIGTAGLKAWGYLSPQSRQDRRNKAFQQARRDFAERQGRPMTVEEVRAMGRGFLEASNLPVTRK
jgi:hypothetical protein